VPSPLGAKPHKARAWVKDRFEGAKETAKTAAWFAPTVGGAAAGGAIGALVGGPIGAGVGAAIGGGAGFAVTAGYGLVKIAEAIANAIG